MPDNAYIPSGGLTGKLKRLQARLLARDSIRINPDRLVISISFDDFPKSAAEVGAQELECRDWRGTYYASAGFAGTNTHHGLMFDAGDISRLQEAEHEIACHTLNHVDLGKADTAMTTAQSDGNRAALQELGLKGGLPAFAYPYGEAAPRNKRVLSNRHETLRGVRPGVNRTGDDRNLLKAVGIDGGVEGLTTAHAYIDKAAEQPGWLILYAHDIQDDPTEWGCTPTQFTDVLDHIREVGAEVLPVTEAYRSLIES
jgi:peptidoglycan/xylan/chitin deacetylase (PgdA/CDA1 family)